VDSLGLLALQMGLGLLISNTSQEVFDKVISPRWQRLSSQQSNGSSSTAYPTRQEQANAWNWTSNLDFDTLVWLYAELIVEQWLWESRIYKRNEADSETLGWLMTKLRDRGREAKSYDFSPPVARQMR